MNRSGSQGDIRLRYIYDSQLVFILLGSQVPFSWYLSYVLTKSNNRYKGIHDLSTMREGRREWECDLRDDSSRWELTHVTKHSPRISPYRFPPKSYHLSDCILTLSCLSFCVILCEPINLILDFVGIYVRYHENGA